MKKTLEMVQIINYGKTKLFESKVSGNKYLQEVPSFCQDSFKKYLEDTMYIKIQASSLKIKTVSCTSLMS